MPDATEVGALLMQVLEDIEACLPLDEDADGYTYNGTEQRRLRDNLKKLRPLLVPQ